MEDGVQGMSSMSMMAEINDCDNGVVDCCVFLLLLVVTIFMMGARGGV